jgi:hypothetical protein
MLEGQKLNNNPRGLKDEEQRNKNKCVKGANKNKCMCNKGATRTSACATKEQQK